MQVLNVAGFEKRILYNACKAYAGQIKRGEDYHLLTDVIAITITDFVMFAELADIVTKFRLQAETGQVIYSDDLELVFAELPKFTKTEQELETVLDRWFYFLKHAGNLEVVPASLQTEPAIVEAFDIANKAGLTPEELDDQERREIFIQDQRGAIMLAEQRGMQKGREEGIRTGRDEEKLRIARTLLDIMDDALIAEKTGLPLDEVRQLRSEAASPAMASPE
ncbi:MAG: Rpn family recombination-promoting nuclease/putative transposase [Candidatus Competibacteraceae bacterium]